MPSPDVGRTLQSMSTDAEYAALRKLGDLGREFERRRPDPYPRPNGPPPTLEALHRRRDEIMQVVARHGGRTVRVFGSVARGDTEPCSDLDLLVEMGDGPSVLKQAALQNELEELLGCPVHVLTTAGLRHARKRAHEAIETEAVSL